ncbi:uncharacterized protein LOC130990392 [Salvia miltiorrhiza]|uniref:uncharacterized protein LOC130990392 n=1 Tax=Salvia miltiorrhiza TaxID=226208 RepID=UPI0025AB9F13|nr:uncharacterized protein LOC130990392 [Salvia miltiorrhiza]
MAISLSTIVSSSIPILALDSSKRAPRARGSLVIMCATNPAPSGLQIRSYDHNKIKVFEDKLNGIICYKDGNGEMICEGYDEGPRFSQQISRFTSNSSGDAEIIELLQRCLLHASDEKELTIF